MNSKSLRSALGKTRGLGSAKLGTEHFLIQRLSAILLIPLGIWFCFSIASIPQMDYANFVNWLSSPISTSLMILTVMMCYYHAYLGLQIVIEDYVSDHAVRFSVILAVQILSILMTVISIVSILKVTLGGNA